MRLLYRSFLQWLSSHETNIATLRRILRNKIKLQSTNQRTTKRRFTTKTRRPTTKTEYPTTTQKLKTNNQDTTDNHLTHEPTTHEDNQQIRTHETPTTNPTTHDPPTHDQEPRLKTEQHLKTTDRQRSTTGDQNSIQQHDDHRLRPSIPKTYAQQLTNQTTHHQTINDGKPRLTRHAQRQTNADKTVPPTTDTHPDDPRIDDHDQEPKTHDPRDRN